ncbi:MAG: metallophosphoesterase [Vicinamibacterales bacterium]
MSPVPKAGRFTRRELLQGLAAGAVGTVVGTVDHGSVYQRGNLMVTRETIRVSGLSDVLSGLRIGFLSDLHRSEMVSHEMVDAAVRLLLAEHTDLIILGGDYVTFGGGRNRRYVGPAADALAPLSAPHGVFAILGNHDDDRDMPAALSAKGFTVLRDSRTRLVIKGVPLDLAGIRFWTRRVSDIASVVRGASTNLILLAHTPSRLPEAASLEIPLMLSGHTHGGQIVLPGLGAIAAREFPVVAGSGRREGTAVFVTRGVGTVYVPVRLNCPPEVAVITLEPVPLAS